MKHTIVEDSHFRKFLKEEGYGFIAEFWMGPNGRQVRPMNKGVDQPLDHLYDLIEEALEGAMSLQYYVVNSGEFYELRQERFRGEDHPHDVMAIARNLEEMESYDKLLGGAAAAVEQYRLENKEGT